MKDFLALLKEKELEDVSGSYLSDLIKGYLERKSGVNFSNVIKLSKYVFNYNKANPNNPIKGTDKLIDYHYDISLDVS